MSHRNHTCICGRACYGNTCRDCWGRRKNLSHIGGRRGASVSDPATCDLAALQAAIQRGQERYRDARCFDVHRGQVGGRTAYRPMAFGAVPEAGSVPVLRLTQRRGSSIWEERPLSVLNGRGVEVRA